MGWRNSLASPGGGGSQLTTALLGQGFASVISAVESTQSCSSLAFLVEHVPAMITLCSLEDGRVIFQV